MNRCLLVHENRHTANIDPGGGLHQGGAVVKLTKPGTNAEARERPA